MNLHPYSCLHLWRTVPRLGREPSRDSWAEIQPWASRNVLRNPGRVLFNLYQCYTILTEVADVPSASSFQGHHAFPFCSSWPATSGQELWTTGTKNDSTMERSGGSGQHQRRLTGSYVHPDQCRHLHQKSKPVLEAVREASSSSPRNARDHLTGRGGKQPSLASFCAEATVFAYPSSSTR